MITGLYVLGNHNLNITNTLELKNKIDKRLNNFSLINIEYLRELGLLRHNDVYGDIDENEKIEEKIIRMSINQTDSNKVNFEKEFTENQKYRQLEIVAKKYSMDQIINENEFKSDYWYIGDDFLNGTISVHGCLGLSFNIDYNLIDFNTFIQYKDWIHLHKIIRDEWRKYYCQIIKLFGGNKAIYIPYYIWQLIIDSINIENVDINIYKVEEYLIEIFGENNKKIDKILDKEYCGYIIDDFSDINLDKNMNINDFKKYLEYL